MKKLLVVSNWADASLLFSEARVEILERCQQRPHSIKELSEAMGLNPGSIHNHIKKLHQAGFLELVETRIINGIEEKKYAKAAEFISISGLPEEDLPKRNEKVAHEVKKKIRHLMEVDPKAEVRRTSAYLREEDIEHVKQELERLREYIREHQVDSNESPLKCTWLFAIGVEEEGL